ncbi:hypothetical protein RF11_13103 [Thelohanellus kitauei]|uniref:Tc1-like transposase DDE domain-containing protein n=1 Tax=Thelohanellus kitauei TaxID=669202 RepID=A0A0C2J9J2_THEKT|nr:hypothetical protein RF11_13103 [Thelohanellus kitauei]
MFQGTFFITSKQKITEIIEIAKGPSVGFLPEFQWRRKRITKSLEFVLLREAFHISPIKKKMKNRESPKSPQAVNLSQLEGVITIGPLSAKLNKSDSDIGDSLHLELFKAQDHPFNEERCCGYFMEALEMFLFSGIHEFIFITDNVRFHKTNTIQTMLQENDCRVMCLQSCSTFLYQIENLLPRWKKIVKQRPRDQKLTYLIKWLNRNYPL